MRFRLDPWLWGCPVILAIWGYCAVFVGPRIEDGLRERVQRAEEGRPSSPLRGLGAHVEVAGRDVVIVADLGIPAAARLRAESEAAAIPGVRRVSTEVTAPIEMSPFPFVLTRRGSRLVVTGGIPSAALHAALLERIYARIPADNVDDRLRLGRGEPPGFDEAARFLLDAVLRLPDAEGTLTGRVFTFKGTAGGAQDYNAVAAVLASPPPGYAPGLLDLRPPRVSPFVWRAVKAPDSLTLEGNVPSERERHALIAAASAGGADAVVDRMQTAGGLKQGLDFAALARASVDALRHVGSGRAGLSGTRFTFAGNVVAKDEFASLEGDLRRELPGGFDIGPITIGTEPVSPFVFTARRGGGRVTLRGYAPDAAQRTAILQGAKTLFIGEDVVDRLHEADGAPQGFQAVAGVALDTLADLAQGEARIDDRTLHLTGQSLYAELAQRLRTSVPASVPSGWTATVAIRTVPADPPLDAARCGDLLGDLAQRQPIRFDPGTKVPSAASAAAVEAARDVVRRCGAVEIEVAGRAGGQDGLALAKARAEAVASALADGAVDARLSSTALTPGGGASTAGSGDGQRTPTVVDAGQAGPRGACGRRSHRVHRQAMIPATIFLLESIWPSLGCALVVGLVCGGLGAPERPRSWIGWAGLLAAGLALAAAAILALTGAVAGQPGLWLDLAVWLGLACAAGGLVGTFMRRLTVARATAGSAR